MTKPAFEDDLHGSDNTTHSASLSAKFKIDDEFLKILRDNTFNGVDKDDVIDHMAKFHLVDMQRNGRDNEIKGTTTTWNELVSSECDIRDPNDLCKSEEFTVIRYSIGSDEEFITLSPSKYDT
ncbi:hypothetical protein Tco_0444914 [Tanacetum coccineum]